MSDDLIGGDIKEHYIYLLFKYAHIAVPNARMAAAYKANYDFLPEYMKLDGHDDNGSIDAYVVENPPLLTYNDYGIASRTKARLVYNMVRALNTAWLSDPLYDGRPLIEVVGIQGHDSIGKTLASDNQYALALYASLIDEGLLTSIAYSEFDLKIPTDTPGGGATAPAVLNVKQSDALGYQYALMYKLFTRFAPYIDHIISWGVSGSGWQGSYVLFDSQGNANSGYYGAMNPDRYILGHSYLDDYFKGEFEKLQDDYVIDLGDLGFYKPKKESEPRFVRFEEISVETEAGIPPVLPDAVEAVFSDGSRVSMDVSWEPIDEASYTVPGTFTVEGTVEGISIKAVATVTVKSKRPFVIVPSGNLVRDEGIKATVNIVLNTEAEHSGTEAVVFQLMNGEIPVSIIALEKDITSDEQVSAFFNVDPSIESYRVEVFVFDEFNNSTSSSPVVLAEKKTME